MGSGASARFWTDSWLLSGHQLHEVALQPIPHENLNLPISHFYEAGRGWKTYLFSNLVPRRFLQEITCDKTPFNPPNTMDVVRWSRDPASNFTTKTTYDLVSDHSHPRQNVDVWKLVWKINGPQRVKILMWKLLNNGVLTNSVRRRRRMTSSDLCPLCQTSAEECLHLFRDCSAVREFWLSAVHLAADSLFFTSDWNHWLVLNLSGHFMDHLGMDWSRFFAAAIAAI